MLQSIDTHVASIEDALVGRRISQRHRLDISARIICASLNLRVQMEDISASGACVRLMHPQALSDGRLCWLNFAVYARVVWHDGIRCGLAFDEHLTDECLQQTTEFGQLLTADKSDKFLRLASAWVHGPGDW